MPKRIGRSILDTNLQPDRILIVPHWNRQKDRLIGGAEFWMLRFPIWRGLYSGARPLWSHHEHEPGLASLKHAVLEGADAADGLPRSDVT